MGEGEARRLVTLHQREGRARHFPLAVEPRDERAGEGRLAGAERPRQRDDVARFQQRGETAGEDVEPNEINIVETETSGHPARLGLKRCSSLPASSVTGCCFSGSNSVTRVPRPGAESSVTAPPCSSAKLLTMESPSPSPRWLEPCGRLSKRSNTAS